MKRLFLLPFLILMGGWVAPARAQQTSTITASGSDCTTAGACVISGLDTNAASVAFTLSGTWSGTVQFTGSTLTSGSNPAAVNCQPPNSTSAVTSATANGTWTCAVAGLRWFALRASTLSSGTVNVVLNTSPAISAALLSGGGGGGGSGTVTSVSCVSGCTITNPTTTPAITVTAGGGNVTGPGTSVVNDVATYANTSGTVLLDGGGPLPASLANSSHKWLNSYTLSTGLFTQTQPAISDLTATFSSPLSLSTNTLSCPTCVTSAASLTQYGVVIGGGLQASSTISADTTTTHALFATATAPAFRAIAITDLPTITIAGGGTNATSAPSAGAVPNTSSSSAASWTVTPSLGLSGTAGTLSLYPTSGNFTSTLGSVATASNTVDFFATAPVTLDLIECVTTSTTCVLTDTGVLAANVTTNAVNYPSNSVTYATGNHTQAGSANLTWVSPTLTIGVAGTTTGSLLLASSTATGSVTLTPASAASAFTVTIPAATDTLVNLAGTQTLTNKSIAGSEINSSTVGATYGGTGLNSSSSTGIAQLSSGTWSFSTA